MTAEGPVPAPSAAASPHLAAPPHAGSFSPGALPPAAALPTGSWPATGSPSRLAAAVEIACQVGAITVVRDVLPWLVRRRYVVIALTLPPARPAAPATRPIGAAARSTASAARNLTLEVVGEADVDAVAAFRPTLYTSAGLRERLRQGHVGLVGRIDGRIVHSRWLFVGTVWLPYLRRRLVLAPDDVYLDEAYTHPAWRQRGVMTAVGDAMPAHLAARGVRRVLAMVAAWNRAPQRTAAAFGYRIVGTVGYWLVPGPRRLLVAGRVRELGGGVVIVQDA